MSNRSFFFVFRSAQWQRRQSANRWNAAGPASDAAKDVDNGTLSSAGPKQSAPLSPVGVFIRTESAVVLFQNGFHSVRRRRREREWNVRRNRLREIIMEPFQSDTRARFPRFLFFIFFSPLFFSVYFRRSDHVGRNVRPSFFHISDADTSAARFFIDPSSTPDRCVHRIFMKPRSVPNLLDFNYNPVPRN